MPTKVFLVFDTLVLVLNTDGGQDSRSRPTFEKSVLEQQHNCSNFERSLCDIFKTALFSIIESEFVYFAVNQYKKREIITYVRFMLFEQMRNFLEPSCLKLTLK